MRPVCLCHVTFKLGASCDVFWLAFQYPTPPPQCSFSWTDLHRKQSCRILQGSSRKKLYRLTSRQDAFVPYVFQDLGIRKKSFKNSGRNIFLGPVVRTGIAMCGREKDGRVPWLRSVQLQISLWKNSLSTDEDDIFWTRSWAINILFNTTEENSLKEAKLSSRNERIQGNDSQIK